MYGKSIRTFQDADSKTLIAPANQRVIRSPIDDESVLWKKSFVERPRLAGISVHRLAVHRIFHAPVSSGSAMKVSWYDDLLGSTYFVHTLHIDVATQRRSRFKSLENMPQDSLLT